MNKRLMSGMAVAASTFALTNAEALAQQPDACRPVVDETTNGQVLPALQKEIGAYAAHGVSVNVRLLKDARPLGIANTGDITAYQEKLVQDCGWDAKNTLGVFVSSNPRLFHVHETGKTEQDISVSELKDKSGGFIDDLRDNTTPYQADVAHYLARLDVYDRKPSHFPWENVLESLGGLLLAGGLVSRLIRGRSIRRVYQEGAASATTSYDGLTAAIAGSEDQLRTAPSTDAKQVRATQKAAVEQSDILERQIGELVNGYRHERRRLWPDLRTLQERAEDLEAANEAAQAVQAQAQTESEAYEQRFQKLPAQIKEADECTVELRAVAEKLKADGWDISSLDAKAPELQQDIAAIKALVQKGEVDQPSELLDAYMSKTRAQLDSLQSMPRKREELDKEIDALPGQVAAIKRTAKQARATLAGLSEAYDASCWTDLEAAIADSDDFLSRLEEISHAMAAQKGILSEASLSTTDKLAADYYGISVHMTTAAQMIAMRRPELQDLQTSLPTVVSELETEMTDLNDFISHYEGDVSDEIKDQAAKLKHELLRVKTLAERQAKPPLLKLKAKTDELNTDIEALANEAAEEHRRRLSHRRNNYDSYLSGGSDAFGGALVGGIIGGALGGDFGGGGFGDFGGGFGGGGDFGGGFSGGGGDFGGGF